MTKAEAAEKIVQKCESYNRCGDCPLYVRANFTKCALAIMIGVVPTRWEDIGIEDDKHLEKEGKKQC